MTGPSEHADATTAQEILAARARRLARRIAAPRPDASTADMLGFTVGRERFAIESRFVFAVMHLHDLVPLPGAQAPVAGVTRWRGDVLTVLDLRRVAGGAPRALDDLGRVIVVGDVAPEFGVLADVLDGLLTVDMATVHPLPATRAVEIPGLIRGVTTDAVHLIDAGILIAHQTGAPVAAVTPPGAPPSMPGVS